MKDDRLQSLLRDLEVDEPTAETLDPAARGRVTDPFFTARVLDALPSPLAFTGLTPRQRVALLTVVYGLAAAAGYAVLTTFAPESVGTLAQGAHELLEQGGSLSWPWALVAIVVVGLVAFAATRSHTSTA